MRKNPLNIAAVICAALFLSSGCTADPAEDTKPVKVELPQDIEKCLVKPPKEPLACTMQYDPVCGIYYPAEPRTWHIKTAAEPMSLALPDSICRSSPIRSTVFSMALFISSTRISRSSGKISSNHSTTVCASENENNNKTPDRATFCLKADSNLNASRIPRNEFPVAATILAIPPRPDFTTAFPQSLPALMANFLYLSFYSLCPPAIHYENCSNWYYV